MIDLNSKVAHGPDCPDGTSDPEWSIKLATIIACEARDMPLSDAIALIGARIQLVRAEGMSHGMDQAQRTVMKAFDEHLGVSRETEAAQ